MAAVRRAAPGARQGASTHENDHRDVGQLATRLRASQAPAIATQKGQGVTVTLHIRTVSEMNRREHYMAKARRHAAQKACASMMMAHPLLRAGITRRAPPASGRLFEFAARSVTVTMTRIGPRVLDSDNLAGALKYVRDGIALALGIDDRDSERLAWVPKQRTGPRGVYSVEVAVGVVGLTA